MSASVSALTPMEPDLEQLKLEILLRLRWSILGSVEDITIEIGLREDGTEECQPFLSHPLALESVAVPPVSRIQVCSLDINEARHFNFISEEYAYDIHTIENADGSPITIKDFVIEVHKYLSKHQDALILHRRKCGFMDPSVPVAMEIEDRISYYKPGKHELFFKDASSSTFGDALSVGISTFMEGELRRSAEAFWQSQRKDAASMAHIREHPEENKIWRPPKEPFVFPESFPEGW